MKSTIRINWDLVDDAELYEIKRDGNIIGITAQTHFDDNNADYDTTYNYSVKSIDTDGSNLNSNYSQTIDINTPKRFLEQWPNAAMAFSMRQLTTIDVDVVRVRRGVDEMDFNATEIVDGTLTSWCGSDDGYVVKWYDQSGNGLHAFQNVVTKQPKIVRLGVLETTGIRNKPCISTGAEGYFLIPDMVDAKPSAYSLFAQSKDDHNSNADSSFFIHRFSDGTVTRSNMGGVSTQRNYFYFGNQNGLSANFTPRNGDTQIRIAFIYDSALTQPKVWVDDIYGYSDFKGGRLFNSRLYNGGFSQITYVSKNSEFIVYYSNMESERLNISDNQEIYWG